MVTVFAMVFALANELSFYFARSHIFAKAMAVCLLLAALSLLCFIKALRPIVCLLFGAALLALCLYSYKTGIYTAGVDWELIVPQSIIMLAALIIEMLPEKKKHANSVQSACF